MTRLALGLLALLLSLPACAPTKRTQLLDSYAVLEQDGGFRLDRDPGDAVFDAKDLARNFRRIAFEFEDNPFDEQVAQKPPDGPARLLRWEGDIRYVLHSHGAGAARGEGYLKAFLNKLSDLTGRRFRKLAKSEERPADAPAADLVVVMTTGPTFDQLLSELGRKAREPDSREGLVHYVSRLRAWHRSTSSPCGGWLSWRTEDETEDEDGTGPAADDLPVGTITFAAINIRSDLSDLLTRACIEEELAQVMGLPNDHEDVRPSMFNDDEEFALLTRHDEMLLKILYDPRLSTGMTQETAMPIVGKIARELTAGL